MNSTAYENFLAFIKTHTELSDADKMLAEELLEKVYDEAYEQGSIDNY